MHGLETSDLNHLLALDALLQEVSVSGAARRLGLSTPAMSHALARLRERFDDPLLVRAGRSMVLTPRAEGLRSSVREAVAAAGRVFSAPAAFEPSRLEGARGLRRRVARAVPFFQVALAMTAGGDYVLTASERLVRGLGPGLGLKILAPPLPLRPFALSMVWHPRFDGDAAHSWLREQLAEAARALALVEHKDARRRLTPGDPTSGHGRRSRWPRRSSAGWHRTGTRCGSRRGTRGLLGSRCGAGLPERPPFW